MKARKVEELILELDNIDVSIVEQSCNPINKMIAKGRQAEEFSLNWDDIEKLRSLYGLLGQILSEFV